MDNEKIAGQLVKLAKEIMSYGGKHIAVRDLPASLQRALKSIGYGRRDIEVVDSGVWFSSNPFEGNRAVSYTVDLKNGFITDAQKGSWGGANPFQTRSLDRDERRTVPHGSAVISGEKGGRGNFLSIYVNPGALKIEEEAVDLSADEKRALNIIGGIKSGYRQDEFRRYGLGEYGPNNWLIQNLADKGLVKIMRTGIQITTKGRNLR